MLEATRKRFCTCECVSDVIIFYNTVFSALRISVICNRNYTLFFAVTILGLVPAGTNMVRLHRNLVDARISHALILSVHDYQTYDLRGRRKDAMYRI